MAVLYQLVRVLIGGSSRPEVAPVLVMVSVAVPAVALVISTVPVGPKLTVGGS